MDEHRNRFLADGARRRRLARLAAAAVVIAGGCAQGGPIRDRIRERIEQRRAARTTASFPVIEGTYDSPASSPYAAGDFRRRLRHGGRDRFYDVHVPAGYSKSRAVPVVLSFHGGGGNPVQQRETTGMDAVSDARGFIAVYPAGTGRMAERFLTFNAGIKSYARDNNVDDVGFTAAVIADLGRVFAIDPKRVYATGFSNGAFLSYRLAAELSDKIAAIAPVSGVFLPEFAPKKPGRAVPVIHFHGKKDPNVVYDGGVGPKAVDKVSRPGALESVMWWVRLNGCPEKPASETRVGSAVCRRYGPGRDGSEVVLWTLENGGHTWPGGTSSLPESAVGAVNTDISASAKMWEFFEKHRLP